MLQIDETIISLDVLERNFCCDISQCLGACCIEGEDGAPLEEEEITIIEQILPDIREYLLSSSLQVIDQSGICYKDQEGDWVTSIVNGRECVFAYYENNGICKCAIEKHHLKTGHPFTKPISCHLYPIRIKKYPTFEAINLHRWKVCKAAETLGRKEKIPVYRFLKTPLIRKYGQEWFNQLEIAVNEIDEWHPQNR